MAINLLSKLMDFYYIKNELWWKICKLQKKKKLTAKQKLDLKYMIKVYKANEQRIENVEPIFFPHLSEY